MARRKSIRGLAGFVRFGSHLKLPAVRDPETGRAQKAGTLRVRAFQKLFLRDFFAGVTELVVLLPKKNGKTSICAAIGIHHLLTVEDADCVIVANSGQQAMKLFDEARGFIQRSPELGEQLRVLRGYREIRLRDPEDPDNPKRFLSHLKVLAADEDTADGWGGTLAIVDEYHRAKTPGLYGVLNDGLDQRAGQMITISTPGEDEDSPLGRLRAKAYAMPTFTRKGAHRYATDGQFSLHEWALEPTEDLEDMSLVRKANPLQTVEQLRRRRASPSMNDTRWARFACGIWGVGGDPAFDRIRFAALASGPDAPDEGRKITLGFDGARRRDGTALVGADLEDGKLFVIGYWQRPAHADDDWEVPEHEVDQMVAYAFDRWVVTAFYADPPYWESAVDRWAGIHGARIVVRWWTNRFKNMALALRAFTNDQVPDRMSHDGDERLIMHVANAVRVETRMIEDGSPLWLISKPSPHSPRKIDLAMAAVLAWKARGDSIGRGALEPEPEYETAQW